MAAVGDDSEWELIGEQNVVCEFSERKNSEFLRHGAVIHVCGLHTAQPFLQVDNSGFAGKFEDTNGTCLLYAEREQPEVNDAVTGGEPARFELVATSSKVLILEPIKLTEKQAEEETQQRDSAPDATSTNIQSAE